MNRAHRRSTLVFAALGLCVSSCGSDAPVDVTGMYSLTLTSGPNDCMFAGWRMGESSTGVPFTLTQDPNDRSMATGRVEGLVGAFARLSLGTADFKGTVSGPNLDLKTLGGLPATREGGCSFTRVAFVAATLKGDLLEGTIRYQFETNSHADCAYRNTCRSLQNFNGTRPPK